MKRLFKSIALLIVSMCVAVGSVSVSAGNNQVIAAQNTQTDTKSGGNETPFIPKHNYVPTVTPPTCTEGGYTTYYCAHCGDSYVADHTSALGHDWDNGTVTAPATCTADGVRSYTCKRDASHTRTAVIPASGHDWDNGTVTKEATCAESGIKTYTCKNDPSHSYSEIIPKAEHTPGETVRENETPSTCSTIGSCYEVVFCSVCGIEISKGQKTLPIDAHAHDFGEWVQTKAPTETEPGEETRTCKNDPSHKERREIAPLGHSQVELTFLDNEVIIVVPGGAIPDGSEFDVQKIVPPPAEVVEKVRDQTGSSSNALAYYKIRLFDTDGTVIFHLDGEITVKTKMPEQYVGNNRLLICQEDETGKLINMTSWWEDDYLCYKTDWLELYN